jgi:GTP cyclohydrolase II
MKHCGGQMLADFSIRKVKHMLFKPKLIHKLSLIGIKSDQYSLNFMIL